MVAGKTSVPVPVEYKPTIDRTSTRAGKTFSWWDADKVRFLSGKPRKIGGWQKAFSTQLQGTPRTMITWSALDGTAAMGIGTNLKYYTDEGGAIADITPIRLTASLAGNPLASSSGSGIVTVTHTNHGALENDFVTISGATTFGGLAVGFLNKEHQITAVIDSNTYTIDTGGTASSSTSGGGASVSAEYQLNTGLDSAVLGTGWGAGTWGRGTWGSAASVVTFGSQLRVWSNDTWGEDLVINPRGGAIFYYDISAGSRAVNISTLSGASDTPTVADQVLSAGDARIMIAFGTNIIGTSTYDPMHYRWCDLEDLADWTPTTSNASGGANLPIGSMFMQAVRTRQEIIAFTDKAIYAIQFVGGEDVFAHRMIADFTIAGPKSAVVVNDRVFVMGLRDFFVYDGFFRPMNSLVREYVFTDINAAQIWKSYGATNSIFNEVWWFYPSSSSEEIDRYVIYNYEEGSWCIGSMERTAWADHAGSFHVPRAADSSGYIYDHETGLDDGSTTPATGITAYIEGSAVELGDGYRQGFLRSIWPDLTFNSSTATSPSASFIMKLADKPFNSLHSTSTNSVVRTATSPIEAGTSRVDVGKRGRFVAFRIESSDVGVDWILGTPRVIVTEDGRR